MAIVINQPALLHFIKVVFKLGTRASPVVQELKLPVKTTVWEGGQLDIPSTTIIERGTYCDVHVVVHQHTGFEIIFYPTS